METLIEVVTGTMPPGLRVWSALAPALLVTAWFVVGLAVFAVRSALRGVPRDQETIQRGGSVLVAEYLRHYFFWLVRPVWRAVERSGVPPTALTTLSVLLALGSGVAGAAGRFALAGWLFIFSGILDTFDGRLARLRQTATPWGAAIDSTLDRWSDSAVLAGLGWYYRDTWVLAPVLLSMIGTAVVPYVRARGEGLGVLVKDGMMQRVERVMYLGAAVALSPVLEALLFPADRHPMHWMAAVSLCALALTSNYTAVVRLRAVVRALRVKGGQAGTLPGSPLGSIGLSTVGAGVATLADFAVAVALVSGGAGAAVATAAGCVVGALGSFIFNRVITFRSTAAALPQAGRYALVSLTSLALNAGGVALLLSHPALSYAGAWSVVRVAVFVLWNHPLHAQYVFGDEPLERGHAT
jgi:phosphatidylglycerophosphate synthase/putative flippase GtrA